MVISTVVSLSAESSATAGLNVSEKVTEVWPLATAGGAMREATAGNASKEPAAPLCQVEMVWELSGAAKMVSPSVVAKARATIVPSAKAPRT